MRALRVSVWAMSALRFALLELTQLRVLYGSRFREDKDDSDHIFFSYPEYDNSSLFTSLVSYYVSSFSSKA